MNAVIPPAVADTNKQLLAGKEERAAYRDFEQAGLSYGKPFSGHEPQHFSLKDA